MTEPITLFVSVDTEEDNWTPARTGITVENIREIPRLDAFFERFGVPVTYFVTYQVAMDASAAGVLREIAARGRAEIGAHLHPWNTPPTTEPMLPRLTMAKHLPYDLQLAKLKTLTTAITDAFGAAPSSFRAGRYGLGADTVRALLECGYSVDASVTPTANWREYDDGPDFEAAPIRSHRVAPGPELRHGADDGLYEVTNSYGYSRRPFRFWGRVHKALGGDLRRASLGAGIASRLGLVRRVVLTPELNSARDMLRLSRCLIAEGASHLQLFLHSPTLRPGLTPYTQTSLHVDHFLGSIETYLEGLTRITPVRFATVSAAESLLEPAPATWPKLAVGKVPA